MTSVRQMAKVADTQHTNQMFGNHKYLTIPPHCGLDQEGGREGEKVILKYDYVV